LVNDQVDHLSSNILEVLLWLINAELVF